MEITILKLKEMIANMPDEAICVIAGKDHRYLPAEISLEQSSVRIECGKSKSYSEYYDGGDVEYQSTIVPVLTFR